MIRAQDTVFQFSAPAAKDIVAARVLTPTSGGASCLALDFGQRQQYILLDSAFHTIDQFAEEVDPSSNMFLLDRAHPLGTVVKGSAYHHYFTVQSPHRAEILYDKVIDFSTHTTTEAPLLNTVESTIRLGYFLDSEDKPYLLSSPLHGNALYFEREGPGGDVLLDSIETHNIAQPAMVMGYVRYVPEGSPQRLDAGAETTLAFTRGRQLVLITHHRNSDPWMVIVNLETFQAHVKVLSTRVAFNDLDTTQPFSIGTSILDDKLFVVKSQSSKTDIGIFQIPTLDMLGDLVLNAANASSLSQAPVQYNAWQSGKRGIIDFYSVKDFYQDLVVDRAALAACKDKDGHYILTFGYVHDPWSRYDDLGRPFFYLGHMGLTDEHVPLANGDFGALVFGANARQSANFDPQDVDRKRPFYPGKMFFHAGFAKVVLDPSSLEPIPTAASLDAEENLWNVLSPDGKMWSPVQHFRLNGRYCAGAFNKVTGKYLIWEIAGNSR
jgi:hypothetical protein